MCIFSTMLSSYQTSLYCGIFCLGFVSLSLFSSDFFPMFIECWYANKSSWVSFFLFLGVFIFIQNTYNSVLRHKVYVTVRIFLFALPVNAFPPRHLLFLSLSRARFFHLIPRWNFLLFFCRNHVFHRHSVKSKYWDYFGSDARSFVRRRRCD